MRKPMPFTLSADVAEAAATDKAAALAFFLMDSVGSLRGMWHGRISAKDQRTLFGRFIGKGHIYIDGEDETVRMFVSKAFGTMADLEAQVRWADLRMAAR